MPLMRRTCAAALLMPMLAVPAHAQVSRLPMEVQEVLATLGPKWGTALTERIAHLGGAGDLLHCGISSRAMAAMGPACVKTHTSAKCRKYNSATRYRTSCAQHDSTPWCAISSRSALPLKADMVQRDRDVHFVPKADILSNGCLSISDPGPYCRQLISFREHTHQKSEIFFCHCSRHHPLNLAGKAIIR